MNPLDQTTQLVIDLIKKNKATDFEFSLEGALGFQLQFDYLRSKPCNII